MTVGSGLVFARDQTWPSNCGASAPDRERKGWRVARKHAVAVALGGEPLGELPSFLGAAKVFSTAVVNSQQEAAREVPNES
jgi:hypothetical protein